MNIIILTIVLLKLFICGSFSLECYTCDSNNLDCVNEQTSGKTETCDVAIAEPMCGTWIDTLGKTIRDCVDPTNLPDALEICLCKTSSCNKDVCPQQRLQCFQCEGTSDDCVKLVNLKTRPCLNYKLNDKCYVVVDVKDDETTYRGCESDTNTKGIESCINSGTLCKKSVINDQPGVSSDFSCVQCESDNNDDKCATETKRTSCGNVPLGREIKCYTIENDEKIIRDCYYGKKTQQCDDAKGQCSKCPTDGCNNQSFKSLKCRTCKPCTKENEKTAGYCFVQPDKTQDLACYHKVEDKDVSRGCLNTLPQNMKQSCLNNSDDCKICREPECNDKTSFQKCYQCNSKDDENCAKLTDLSKLKAIACPNYEDEECVTWIEDSDVTTHRDCRTSSNNALVCTCKENLCNKEDCPKNRVKCHQCEGENCVILEPGDKKITCNNFDPMDRCFALVDDGIIPETAYRGCMSDTDTTGISKCKSPELSPFCIDGDDNAQLGFSDEFKCVICHTNSLSNDDSCAIKTETTSCGKIPLGRPIQCFTMMDGDQLIRDCYYGEKVNDCDGNKHCRVCKESGCNKEPFRTLSCRKCSSVNNDNCRDKFGKEDEFGFCIAEKYSDEEIACYRMEDESVVTRGCLNMINEDDIKSECKKNSDKCKICNFERCNNKIDFQMCYDCDSNEDENCATLAKPKSLASRICPGYHDECAVYLSGLSGQDTSRSCISNPILECPVTHCDKCTVNFCNIDKYPKTRKKCHRCTEVENPNCVNDLQNSEEFLHYCPKYDQGRGDICFGVIDTSKSMIRGCQTDFDLHEKCLEKESKCISCFDEGCNSGVKIRNPSLSCIDCEPSNLLGNCLWGVAAEKAEKCKDDVWFGNVEDCFTVEYDSDVVRRGCLNDCPDICEDPHVSNYTICSLPACNNENVITQGCLVCDSEEDTSCKFENPNIEVSPCTNGVQEFDERWCYTMTSSLNKVVSRGCFMDLTKELKELCMNQTSNMCDLCHDWGCNNAKPPHSGSVRSVSSKIYILMILGLLLNNF